MAFRELRDAAGKLVARYDPERELLEIKAKGGVKATFDLSKMRGEDSRLVRIPVSAPSSR